MKTSDIQKMSKSVVLYSGNLNQQRAFESGFLILQNWLGYLIEFKPINKRISYNIRLKGKP